jgi:hypothetical protein
MTPNLSADERVLGSDLDNDSRMSGVGRCRIICQIMSRPKPTQGWSSAFQSGDQEKRKVRIAPPSE